MRAITALLMYAALLSAAHSAPPQPAAPTTLVPAPRDLPYPGTIALAVDASNIAQDIFAVHETIPVARGTSLTLLYPEWRPGNHSPTARSRIGRVAGLVISIRYPHLERDPDRPALLDAILAPKNQSGADPRP